MRRSGLRGEELMWQLDHDAGPVARLGVGADRAAMLEILEDGQPGLDDGMAGEVVDIGVETDAAGIMIARGMVEPRARERALPCSRSACSACQVPYHIPSTR